MLLSTRSAYGIATATMGAVGTMIADDGNGMACIGHNGVVQQGPFLPLACGRFPGDSVVDVYQRHPLFRALRDSDGFEGKCGVCEYRSVCGGSRARAFALTGNAFGSDPHCVHQPPDWTDAPA